VPLLPIIVLTATAWAAGSDGAMARGRRLTFTLLALLGFVISLNGILFDFVEHRRWIAQTLRLPMPAHTQFELVASPLVTGWFSPSAGPLDLFWARLLDASQVRAHGRLLGPLGDAVGSHATTLAGAACPGVSADHLGPRDGAPLRLALSNGARRAPPRVPHGVCRDAGRRAPEAAIS
jgi:hypothetical protein